MLRPEIEARLKANTAVVDKAAAAALKPDPRMKLSEWAAKHRVVAVNAGMVVQVIVDAIAPGIAQPLFANKSSKTAAGSRVAGSFAALR
jgi:hypothetical protein